ncbi:MAG: ABC transporter ATP-binding protein [Acidibrevibacterium sp.]|jgi:branched-chain amino acid transport system ATP-binding protein|uniref:ABC transporter ATP-binding protein n=1 Tax=Acidibrevibacterium fodinaquatile TaxID=1969806 RepID=UPI0023A81271|nr:ABC transporter ATP-binding protein [Acidibrevibacterium fodinaquatile]MCA7119041.1 ABC transporter ATP-binding protein [Acidibrevibacterium fodinaquatile]
MTGLLEVSDLDVRYGASQILFGVGFTLAAGQTLALLGRNGAGKSTTMKALAGLLPARKGSMRLAGRDVTGAPPYRLARLGLAYVPEDRQVFAAHTVEDNLLIAQKPGPEGETAWTLARIWESFPLLVPLRRRPAGRLSGGEQQMLAIARALIGNPKILLLDEPSEGLAPLVVASIARLLRDLRAQGATILLAEQNLHFCLSIASDALIIDKGQIVYRDTVAGLNANHEIRSRYLAL